MRRDVCATRCTNAKDARTVAGKIRSELGKGNWGILESKPPITFAESRRLVTDGGHREEQRNSGAEAIAVLQPECFRRAQGDEARQPSKNESRLALSKRHFPTDTDLVADLDKAEREGTLNSPGYLWYWLEQFSDRGDSPDRAFQIAEQWLNAVPSLRRLRIVATLMYEGGRRQHLSILENCVPLGDTPEAWTILTDASYAVRRRSLI
jgi:hypothetical protein